MISYLEITPKFRLRTTISLSIWIFNNPSFTFLLELLCNCKVRSSLQTQIVIQTWILNSHLQSESSSYWYFQSILSRPRSRLHLLMHGLAHRCMRRLFVQGPGSVFKANKTWDSRAFSGRAHVCAAHSNKVARLSDTRGVLRLAGADLLPFLQVKIFSQDRITWLHIYRFTHCKILKLMSPIRYTNPVLPGV